MNPWLSSVLSSHLLDRRDGHRRKVLAAWREKQAADFMTPERRRALQADLLARLLNHCREKVPFYRERLGGVGLISPVNAFDVLRTLPVVSRSDIQQDPNAFVAEGETAAADDATGGSTGTPMRFRVDRSTQVARESSLMWADNLAGWQLGERMAMLWGADRDVKSATRSLRLALRWWLDNRRWFDAFRMGEREMWKYHRKLQRFQPHYLVAYAGALDAFSDFLESHRLKPNYPRHALISSAEVLMPAVRERVERVFDRPVFDRYGNREFGAIAAECAERNGLHLNPADMLVEWLPAGEGQTARRVVITYLRNAVMPFVRYDTEDLAEVTDRACPCGRSTERITRIVGRVSDIIRLADGRLIHGEYFTHMFYGVAGVKKFQFVQSDPRAFVLQVVAPPNVFRENEPRWRQTLIEELGPDARLEIRRVDEIPVTASGKHRFTISQI